ncbi:MAG TPA: hypothetical protein VN577_06265 [Terriglobales bacterium]|nr:hypothetical protein [Terriglobales bacterium]
MFGRRRLSVRKGTLVLLASLAVTTAAFAQGKIQAVAINGRVPLGIESFRLVPAKTNFYLMASAETQDFIGLARVIDGKKSYLVTGSRRQRVKFYPDQLHFRLTASAREDLVRDTPFDTESKLTLEDLLVKLKFRVKIFHGLQYRYVEPESVDEIGMPPNVPYDERIYRIGFKIGKVPIEDRVVMEVFSPAGERLCKFHLDLL